MYLVKALTAASGPFALGEKNRSYAAGQFFTIEDEVVGYYTNNPAAFTVVGGTKNGATVTQVDGASGIVHTRLTCVATPISIADDDGVAQYGGVKVFDFQEGLIHILGAVIDGAITLGTTGTITATWAGGIALGTVVATTGATLTSTEANIMAENDVAAATASVAVVDAVSTAAATINGTATAADMYLNLVVDDHASHTAGTGSFTGTIDFAFILIGDK